MILPTLLVLAATTTGNVAPAETRTDTVAATDNVVAKSSIDEWKTSSLVAAGFGTASGVTAGISGIVLAGRSNGLKSAIARHADPSLIALKERQVAGTQVFVASFAVASTVSFGAAGAFFGVSLFE